MTATLRRAVSGTLRIFLGATFLWAGWAKLDAGRAVAADIVRLQIVPFAWAEWLSAILPVAELLAGVWLIVGWRCRAAALSALLLTATFALAVGQALVRGIDFNCHCFGLSAESPPAGFVLARACALLGGATLLHRLCGSSEATPIAGRREARFRS